MDQLINWYQIRGLALLAILGVFLIYALLVAFYHDWRVKRRARHIATQRKQLAAAPAVSRDGAIRSAESRASANEISAADLPRRAA